MEMIGVFGVLALIALLAAGPIWMHLYGPERCSWCKRPITDYTDRWVGENGTVMCSSLCIHLSQFDSRYQLDEERADL